MVLCEPAAISSPAKQAASADRMRVALAEIVYCIYEEVVTATWEALINLCVACAEAGVSLPCMKHIQL